MTMPDASPTDRLTVDSPDCVRIAPRRSLIPALTTGILGSIFATISVVCTPLMLDAVRNGLPDNKLWVPLFCSGIGFGLQGIILLQFFVYESFLTETIEIRQDSIRVTSRIMGIPRRRVVSLDETTGLHIPYLNSLFYGYLTGYHGAVEARWHKGRRRFGANLNLEEARWVVRWLSEGTAARNESE